MKLQQYLWGMLLVVVSSCAHGSPQQDIVPEHETFTIDSKKLGEKRTITVWMPPQYSATTDSLPVLYMADGGIKEDFPHIATTLADLVARKAIPPMLLVGIENTERRRDLTGFTEVEEDKKIAPVVGGSARFSDFISDELFTAIKQRYRTTDKKGIIGESVAGLYVMETFFTRPQLFDYYIAIDPSLWWNNHYLVRTAKEHLARFPTDEKKLWFAGSGAKDISKYTRELSAILQATSTPSLDWKYSDNPKQKHATIFRATKEQALQWTFGQ
jgi:predicted alpha/beta superfamily hydrolase